MRLTYGYIHALNYLIHEHTAPREELDIQHVSDAGGLGWMQVAICPPRSDTPAPKDAFVVAPSGAIYLADGYEGEGTGNRCALDIPNRPGLLKRGQKIKDGVH